MEHYVTLFDSSFLPSGLCLHESLTEHAPDAMLWVVCMDKKVEQQLEALNVKNLNIIPLESAENARLLSVKQSRSKGEYCWTMTPFAPELVFRVAPDAKRVTYVDADLFFFDNPKPFFDEFEKSQRKVLITEHAFAPEYARWEELSGRFCVQFLTFTNTAEALEVMHWWQDACIDWCYARMEEERFGDQKYLNKWPILFGNYIHILEQTNRTLAPWNIKFFARNNVAKPIFYHFHSLRIIGKKAVKLYEGYKIGQAGKPLYDEYIKFLQANLTRLKSHGINIPYFPEKMSCKLILRRCLELIKQTVKYKILKY